MMDSWHCPPAAFTGLTADDRAEIKGRLEKLRTMWGAIDRACKGQGVVDDYRTGRYGDIFSSMNDTLGRVTKNDN